MKNKLVFIVLTILMVHASHVADDKAILVGGSDKRLKDIWGIKQYIDLKLTSYPACTLASLSVISKVTIKR